MNFGLSGPMADRGDVVLKERIGIEVAGHRHRERALSELLDIEGGILRLSNAGQCRYGHCLDGLASDFVFRCSPC